MDLPRDLLTFGVNVITTRHDGRDHGATVSWLTRIGEADLLALLGADSATAAALVAASQVGVARCVVQVLAEGQQDLGRRFGLQSGRSTDKFAGLVVGRDPHGVAVLPGCRRAISCRLRERRSWDGDHLLILAIDALTVRNDALEPLVLRNEDYR